MLKTIKENIKSEIVEKKSKFIADLIYVQSVEEAECAIKEVKKKYFDAKHHCFAYSIMTKDGIVNRFSDDGEPSGTAGSPMLNIINKNEIINVVVVVTRYFGGILLGTGGLVKAYSEATIKAMEKAQYVIEQLGYEVGIQVQYSDFEKLKFYCQKNNLNIINSIYDEKIICIVEMNKEEKEWLLDNINELSFNIEKIEIIKEKNIRKNIG